MDAWWTAVLLLALSGFSLLAWSLQILDVRGAVASFMLGLLIAFVGGLGWLLLMAVFTGIAFLATRVHLDRKRRLGVAEPAGAERGFANVLGNGLAPALAVLATFLDGDAARLAYATAVAAVLADTLGSEVGVLSDRARDALPPFPASKPGRNGAVSALGQFATAFGAILIALAAIPLLGIPSEHAWVPAVGGFVGGQLDSLLGASLERDYIRNDRPLRKQDVNFLMSFFPALAVFLAVALG
jgi:uncharacterized protein (TIGR00297 family)